MSLVAQYRHQVRRACMYTAYWQRSLGGHALLCVPLKAWVAGMISSRWLTERVAGGAQVLPVVFGALEENANSHWNPAVHGLTCNVRKMFQVGS